ncbi:MAG: endo-1,4-beta-xylanase [Bacteroidales bacterium]|nr:endo-1,4-beta-xylanase [Bacteroidales bacterium]
MKRNIFSRIATGIILAVTVLYTACQKPEPALKEVFSDHFMIGTAMNASQMMGDDAPAKDFVAKHFNSLTAENAMKWERIHPLPGKYEFRIADSTVAFTDRNGMFTVGHTLVWHQQTPKWVFEDSLGNALTRDALLARLKDHIFTVAGRYKGRVKGWDVVNEALDDDGSMRKTKWLEIIGDDYMHKAFEYAKEADPEAELYYNDYNIETPAKRDSAVKLLRQLLADGVKIDGVGIQGHYHMDFPDLKDLDESIRQFGELGLKVMITELDINVLPRPENISGADISQNFELQKQLNPYPESLPDSAQRQLAGRYADMFSIFVRHSDKVSRVTFWGVHDGQSWLNNWPVRGRTNYPLLFDRDYQAKPAFYSVIETVKQ